MSTRCSIGRRHVSRLGHEVGWGPNYQRLPCRSQSQHSCKRNRSTPTKRCWPFQDETLWLGTVNTSTVTEGIKIAPDVLRLLRQSSLGDLVMDELGLEGLKVQSVQSQPSPSPTQALIQDSRALPEVLKAQQTKPSPKGLKPGLQCFSPQCCFFGFCPWECTAKLGNPNRVFLVSRDRDQADG